MELVERWILLIDEDKLKLWNFQTCLLYVFSRDQYPEEYVPTVFETYVATIEIDKKEVVLALWDTAGQEDYDRWNKHHTLSNIKLIYLF